MIKSLIETGRYISSLEVENNIMKVKCKKLVMENMRLKRLVLHLQKSAYKVRENSEKL